MSKINNVRAYAIKCKLILMKVSDKAVKKWLSRYDIINPRSAIFGKSKRIQWEDFK